MKTPMKFYYGSGSENYHEKGQPIKRFKITCINMHIANKYMSPTVKSWRFCVYFPSGKWIHFDFYFMFLKTNFERRK